MEIPNQGGFDMIEKFRNLTGKDLLNKYVETFKENVMNNES
jgi:hypothetical protein